MRYHGSISSQKWLCSLIVTVVLTGVFFRFFNLDQKVYWFDESATTSRISHLKSYVESFKGQIIIVEKLNEYQSLNSLADVHEIVERLF